MTSAIIIDSSAYLRLALATGLPLASKDKALNAAALNAGAVLFTH